MDERSTGRRWQGLPIEEKVVAATWLGNAILVFVKFAVGLWANSIALVAEAAHSFADVVASGAIYLSLRLCRSAASDKHPYGRGKLQALATVGVAVLLLLIAWEVGTSVSEAWRRTESAVPGVAALWVATFCLIAKEAMYRITIAVGRSRGNTMLVADAWHHRTDAFILAGVLIGVAGARAGWLFLDPLAGLLIAVSVARIAVVLGWQGLKQLLDIAPDPRVLQALRGIVSETPGVERMDGMRARQYGPDLCVEVNIAVMQSLSVAEGHDIAVHVKERLHSQSEVLDVIVHVNPSVSTAGKDLEPVLSPGALEVRDQ